MSYDKLLSSFASNFNLRHYTKAGKKAAAKAAAAKAAEGGDTAMEEDGAAPKAAPAAGTGAGVAAEGMDVDAVKVEGEEGEEAEKKKAPEPLKEDLANPARITPAGAYTRPLLTSTLAGSDIKYTLCSH
jgi:hypothetical protein